MSVAGRKLTIRMPDNRRLGGAEVVGIHVDPGGRVREGNPVVTVKSALGEQRIRAPRSGRAVPLVSLGDEVVGGDPLFLLNLDENALSTARSRSHRTILRRGAEAFTTAKREGIALEHPRSMDFEDLPSDGEDGGGAGRWLKPALAFVVYLLACFTLLPVFRQMGGSASASELVGVMVLAVAIAVLIAVFLTPSHGRWPRLAVRFVSFSWLFLTGLVLYPHLVGGPISITRGGAGGSGTGGATVTDARPDKAPPEPPVVARSGVMVGLSDLVPMPRMTLPGGLADPVAQVAPLTVSIRIWVVAAPGRDAAVPLRFTLADVRSRWPAAFRPVAAARDAARLAVPAGLPAGLPDPSVEGIVDPGDALAAASAADRKPGEATTSASDTPLTVGVAIVGKAEKDARVDPPVVTGPGAADPIAAAKRASLPSMALSPPVGGDPETTRVAEPERAVRIVDKVAAVSGQQGADAPGKPMAAQKPENVAVLQGPLAADLPRDDRAANGGALLAALPDRAVDGPKVSSDKDPDPVATGYRRLVRTDWMVAQADRADDGRSSGRAIGRAPDAPVQKSAESGRPGPDRRLAGNDGIEMIPAKPAERSNGADVPVLEVDRAGDDRSAARSHIGTGGALPVLAALSSGLDTVDRPGAAPEVPEVGPQPATRMVLYLFVDDPRLKEHPNVGDEWGADLPPEIARGIWGNRVVAVREIIQVESWCKADGKDAGQAWLNDRIRLLLVRVDMDPAIVPAFEKALPIFGDAAPGFFHNRRPLMGGGPGADLISRARDYLHATLGDRFHDSAASLRAAMQAAGCTGAVWNGGAGPVNALGARLASQFGS